MAQFARPSADVTRNSWVTNSNGTTNLWAMMDEDPPSEVDFVQGSLTVNDFYEFRLSAVAVALIDRFHILRYRGRKNAAAGNTRGVTVELRQGATVIATNSHPDLTVAWEDGIIQLTPAQGSTISNYADLRVRFMSTGVISGTSGVRRRIQMSWCQLRVPDWQPTYENEWGADEDLGTPGVFRYTLNGVTGEGPRREDALVDLWTKLSEADDSDPVRSRRWRMAYYSRKQIDYADLRAQIVADTYPIPAHQTKVEALAIVDAKLGNFAPIVAAADAVDRI